MTAVTFTPVIPPGPPLTAGRTGEPAKLSVPAGWTVTARPRRVGTTDWQGWEPVTLVVPIVFDGFLDDRSVEHDVGTLETYCRSAPGGVQPPVVTVSGPVPGTDLRWCVTSIDWGVEDRRDDGQRIRAYATVNLMEYVPVSLAVLLPPPPSPAAAAAERAGPAPSGAGTYTVKRGDTLSVIAQHVLGNSARWHEIADLNGIRDPRRLQVGQVLRLP